MTHILERPLASSARLDAVFAGVRNALARRRAYLETLRELGALTDRELADLGFARCDLRRVARDSVEARR